MIALPRPAIALVTDRRRLSPDARTLGDELLALERFLDAAVDAAIDLIQIRETDLAAGPLAAFVERIARKPRGPTRVVVNDRVDAALVSGADGVHLRADGMAARRVRELMPAGLIGRSIHARDDPATAGDDADYLLFGTVFMSASKPDQAAAGVEGLGRAVAATRLPVLAIGGITADRARACLRAGAAGVAGIGLFLPIGRASEALGVARAVRELRRTFDEASGADVCAEAGEP